MKAIAAIRNWLERKLFSSLRADLVDGFFTVEQGQKKEQLTLNKMVLEPEQERFLGLIPVFVARKIRSISLAETITARIKAARVVFGNELNDTPAKIIGLAETEFKDSIEKRIKQTKAEVGQEITRLTENFGEQQLRTFVKLDRNKFRQKLLEEIGKQESKIFGEMVRKRLAELVMRVRQEDVVDDTSGVSDSSVENLVALPTGTRFCIRKGKMTIFVVEQAPHTRTMKIMADNGKRSELYQLSFPYMVFFAVLRGRKSESLYAFFRKKPLRDTSDELLCPALPNIFEDFKVCFAPSASKNSLALMVEESINSFWGGRFIWTHDPSNLTRQITIEDWAEGTGKNSLFGLSYDWRDARLNVAKMIDKISTDFVGQSTEKKEKGGGNIMSALDKTISGMTAAIANEMKETCFNLVTAWTPDEVILQSLVSEFTQMVGELSEFARAMFGKNIEEILSEETLKQVFETAVRQTLKSLDDAGNEKPIAAARKALLAELKEKSN